MASRFAESHPMLSFLAPVDGKVWLQGNDFKRPFSDIWFFETGDLLVRKATF
jgi:hypothetical protein